LTGPRRSCGAAAPVRRASHETGEPEAGRDGAAEESHRLATREVLDGADQVVDMRLDVPARLVPSRRGTRERASIVRSVRPKRYKRACFA
jgi:hypothetical protein